MEENEKNISVTLKRSEDNADNISIISFETVFRQIRRFFTVWIVLSVICGMLTAGTVIIFNKTINTDNIEALICFNYEGIENGLDPAGKEFDVNKVKSPNIIEEALTQLDKPISMVELVRRNISIEGIVPNEALDKISLYQEIYSKGGSAGLEAVNSLLNVGYFPSYYIVSFNNNAAGFDIDTGKKIMDEILDAYEDYFFTTYGYNKALGNSIVAVDYKEYDYPAAIDVFRMTLNDLRNYIQNLQNNDLTKFRSSKSGFCFDDILRNIDMIEENDLDSLSAYITVNNITNDKEQLEAYYEYKIEELRREAKVLKDELNSISESINTYEKDSILFFGEIGNLSEEEYLQYSEKYDELVKRKIEVQEKYSTQNEWISYYKLRVEALESSGAKQEVNIEQVEKKFQSIYDKINNLIDTTIVTTDEYYGKVVFANAFSILVPATGNSTVVEMGSFVKPVIITETVLFVFFVFFVFASAIAIDYKKSKKRNKHRKNVKEEIS